MPTSHSISSPQDWAREHRREDGQQQPISLVERHFGIETQRKRFGLELMWPLVEAMGNPQLAYPTIHVAGSKGKGSTVAILASILQAAGYRVGTYVSPSISDFAERVEINRNPIPAAAIEEGVQLLERLSGQLEDRPKFFEAATALAFHYFAQQSVDVAVIEVGLGGSKDATNVVSPEIVGITTLELEHTQILGNTITEIATEKAGIVKPGTPVFSSADHPDALAAIQQRCQSLASELWTVHQHSRVTNYQATKYDQRFDLRIDSRGEVKNWKGLQLSLRGQAQVRNGAMAVAMADRLKERFDRVDDRAIHEGVRLVRLPGRIELRAGSPDVLLDMAHTQSSLGQMADYVERFYPGPRTLVLGLLREKDINPLVDRFLELFDSVILAPVKWYRSTDPYQLQAAFEKAEVAASIRAAMKRATQITPENGLIVVAGSAFAVGEAKRAIQ